MSNEEEEIQIASPLPVILSGLINGLLFCTVYHLSIKFGSENAQNQLPVLNIGFLISTVVWAQIFFRRSIKTKITFIKLMMSGWVASLFFALIVAVFYNWYFSIINAQKVPFAQVLFGYSTMGLVISAIVAFFIARKK